MKWCEWVPMVGIGTGLGLIVVALSDYYGFRRRQTLTNLKNLTNEKINEFVLGEVKKKGSFAQAIRDAVSPFEVTDEEIEEIRKEWMGR